jgi:hypothetical protein
MPPARTKKTIAESAPVPEPEPVPVVPEPEPVPVVVLEEVAETSTDSFVLLSDKLALVLGELKNLQNVVKTLHKEHNKLKKLTSKKSKAAKAKSDGTVRVQSGFAKPTKLSDPLCAFLGLPLGSELARTEVTRKINEYIKQHSLQSEADRRIIVPNDALKSILDIKEGVPLSFFNLQGCLKNHFIKAVV